MLEKRKIIASILSVILLLIILNEAYPQMVNSTHVGPLELSVTNAILLLEASGGSTAFKPTIRLRIINKSVSDVKIILFARSINVTDNLGEELFYRGGISSSGVLLSNKHQNEFSMAFQADKGKFVTLAPKQAFEAKIFAKNHRRVGGHEFVRTHQPRTIDFSGTLGIINLDGSTELRGFSFSGVPLSVVRQVR